MIDQIRDDIERQLEELLAEADRLRQALTALGSIDGSSHSSSSQGAASRRRGRQPRAAAAAGAGTRSPRGRAARRPGGTAGRGGGAAPGSARTRTASGATRQAVLDALAKANGEPLTAGQVASATGLGRPSVSTTLSKLARSGEVTKAQRGYAMAGKSGSGS